MTVCLELDLLRPYGIFPATNSAPRAFRDRHAESTTT